MNNSNRFIIELTEEELAAVYFGLEHLHVHMANTSRSMSDILTVIHLHERIRPDVEAAIQRFQEAQSQSLPSPEPVS